jgi:hypothetical protein
MQRPLLVCLLLALPWACQNSIDSGGADAPAFEVPKNQVELLPFRVRLARIAQVAGVTTDDPMLAEIRDRAAELGDHDFATGVRPNLAWTAARMSTWVKALKPVCTSEAFRARYPDLGTDPSALIAAAWGRPASEADLADIEAALDGADIDSEERTQAVCFAVLSSVELVAK